MKIIKTIFIIFTILVVILAPVVGIPMMAINNYAKEDNKQQQEQMQVEEGLVPIEEVITEIADVEIVETKDETIDVEIISDPAAGSIIEEQVQIEEDINVLPAETKYTTTGVHMRNGPSTDAEVIDTLVINTKVDKIGTEGDWAIVRTNNEKYYIYEKYLSDTETEIKITSRSEQSRSETTQTAAAASDFLGYYTLTYYCSCSKCCGGYANGITAWGTIAAAGRTVAVPKNISLGTKLNINGHIYTAEDRGGAIKGNKIDVYVNSHSEALAKGVTHNVPVWAVK